MNGKGCPECAKRKYGFGSKIHKKDLCSNDICYLYNIKLTGNGEEFYKIGISNDYVRRHKTIYNESGYKVEVINIIVDTRYICNMIERKLISKYSNKNIMYTPEIKFGGYTECYKRP